jgi:hypothetical protein
VAESGASGDSDSGGDARLSDPVDTDPIAIQVPEALPGHPADTTNGATASSPNQFGYLLDDAAEDAPVGYTEPDGIVWGETVTLPELERDEDRFDAFNASTWTFRPPPTPWFRTRQALIAIAAVIGAVIALVVSIVLLVIRGPSDTEAPQPTDTSTAPTTATAPETTSALPPPPPAAPPPPPPPPSAAPPVYNQPRSQPTPKKGPEINVTRSPMSVAPQQRPGPFHR